MPWIEDLFVKKEDEKLQAKYLVRESGFVVVALAVKTREKIRLQLMLRFVLLQLSLHTTVIKNFRWRLRDGRKKQEEKNSSKDRGRQDKILILVKNIPPINTSLSVAYEQNSRRA